MIRTQTTTSPDTSTFRTKPVAEDPLLAVNDLGVTFMVRGAELRAVDGVSFVLEKGRTLGIVGESGSGKSVTARAIMGLLPPIKSRLSGSVRLEDKELVGLTEHQWRQYRGTAISLVFQDPMRSLNPTLRIGLQITEALRSHRGLGKAEAQEAAIDLLSKVRMPAPKQRFHEYPHQLSGGMRQRVMIAIAISCHPQLLIADEPTTALDVTTQAQVMDLLMELQREFQMGLIFISHDIGLAADYTDEIAVMYAGKIVEQAPTRDLIEHARMPYTRALLEAIPRLDAPSHLALPALSGRPPDPIALPPGCAFNPRCAYAQDRCKSEAPVLVGDARHRWACWFPVGEEHRADGAGSNGVAAEGAGNVH
jgi:oligopeptide/dipeptide ABC transporter ATP-binding protein